MLISSNSFMGKQLRKAAGPHPGVTWHRVAENFAQHFCFPEMVSLTDLTRVRSTLFVTITDAALTSSIEKELFHGSRFYCMCMRACTKQQGRFLDCKSQVMFLFCLIQSRDFHLRSPCLKQRRDMNAPPTS